MGPLQLWLYGYGSIPIIINSNGMNIHLPAILMFTRGIGFWHTAIYIYNMIRSLMTGTPNRVSAAVRLTLEAMQEQDHRDAVENSEVLWGDGYVEICPTTFPLWQLVYVNRERDVCACVCPYEFHMCIYIYISVCGCVRVCVYVCVRESTVSVFW